MASSNTAAGKPGSQFRRCIHASTLGLSHMKDLTGSTASPLSVLDILALDSPQSLVKDHLTPSLPPRPLPRPGRSLELKPAISVGSSSRAGSLSSECSTPSKPAPIQQENFDPNPYACPASPPARSRTRPRAAVRAFSRSSSLNDNKVLVATQLKRTASLTCPDLFTFEDHFEFQAVIGRSELSEVYQVRHKHTNELFAVKRSMRKFRSKAHRERCMREIMAVAALPAHPNIVGQYRAWQQGGHFYIQMDLCGGGSLGQLLTQAAKMSTWLPEEAAWQVLYQVSQGLSFLHAHGVLHLDIKPDNIYRDNAGTFKIGDFGLAVLRKQWDWEEGDGNYLAPELLNDASEPSCAADIFSLGATLYECATGEKLPKSGPAREHGQVALPGRSAALQWMIQWMINPDPACRPLAQDVLMQVASLNLPLSGPSDADAFPDSDGGTPATPIASGRTAWQDQDPEHTPVRAIFQASPFSPCPLASPVGLQSPGFALRPALNSVLSPAKTPSPLRPQQCLSPDFASPAPSMTQHAQHGAASHHHAHNPAAFGFASPLPSTGKRTPALPHVGQRAGGTGPSSLLRTTVKLTPPAADGTAGLSDRWLMSPSAGSAQRANTAGKEAAQGVSTATAAPPGEFATAAAQADQGRQASTTDPGAHDPCGTAQRAHAPISWRPNFMARLASPFSLRPTGGPTEPATVQPSAAASGSAGQAVACSSHASAAPSPLIIPSLEDGPQMRPDQHGSPDLQPMQHCNGQTHEVSNAISSAEAAAAEQGRLGEGHAHLGGHKRSRAGHVPSPVPLNSDGSGSSSLGWDPHDPVRPASATPTFTARHASSSRWRQTPAPDQMMPWSPEDQIPPGGPDPWSPDVQIPFGASRPFQGPPRAEIPANRVDDSCSSMAESNTSMVRPFPALESFQSLSLDGEHACQDSLDSNGDAWRSPGGGDAAEGGCGDAVADLDMSGSQHDAAQLKATFCDSPVVPTGHRRSGSHPPDRAGSDMHRREHWSRQTVMASLCSFTAMRASPDPGASPPGPDRCPDSNAAQDDCCPPDSAGVTAVSTSTACIGPSQPQPALPVADGMAKPMWQASGSIPRPPAHLPAWGTHASLAPNDKSGLARAEQHDMGGARPPCGSSGARTQQRMEHAGNVCGLPTQQQLAPSGLQYLPHRQASLRSSADGDSMCIEDMTSTIRQLSMTRELSMMTSVDLDATMSP